MTNTLWPAFPLFFVVFFALWIVGFVFWIVVLVRVCKIPDYQYRAAGTEKLTWILVVVLAGIVGALVWRFAKQSAVYAAAGRLPSPPPGWYPDATGGLRWWDGVAWTVDYHFPPQPGS